MNYTATEVLRVAKRFKNTRRNYLLVNPLQGKHLPVRPTVALEMMNSLGQLVAEKFPSARLVVGFAETATAIGAVVAKNLADDCFYLQTTRENFAGNFVEFLEEHSHAPEQKLFAENLSTLIDTAPEVVFVDDELSTGKTLRNIIRQLKKNFPALDGKKICAASIINRLTDENLAALADENITCVSLVKLNETFDASNFQVAEAQSVAPVDKKFSSHEFKFTVDPRRGVEIGKYFAQCDAAGNFVVDMLKRENISGDVLILGTEEFMLPAIVAGSRLEAENFSVVTHSTTRSPIGICDAENYPIRTGFKLRSFYDENRTTFVYNLRHYDAAVIVTNAQNFSAGLNDLISALNVHGVEKIFIVRC
ncbi:MAG: phosphoribosyltransferase domain-containing protein [Selenomonadaceae bacterium]|nr:phosphoribosyltransferase domain-containing protein [Selenomonadaceae bacterium]